METHLNTQIIKENKKNGMPLYWIGFIFGGVDLVNVGKGAEDMVKDTEK